MAKTKGAVVYSKHQFMALGLEWAGHYAWRTYLHHCNITRYREAYGITPRTMARVWFGLRGMKGELKLPSTANPMHLLLAIRFLWRYEKYNDLGKYFKIRSKNTVKKWVFYYLPRIQSLLPTLIPKWKDAYVGLYFFFTIDGTHCPIEEPFPFNTIWSSHKLGGKPGLNYEIVLRIDKPQLLWIYGPTPPGAQNDISVFQGNLLDELREFMIEEGVTFKGLGDSGYRGEAQYISHSNDLDPVEIMEFKNRALARQETFNQKVKMFAPLKTEFRHGVETHKVVFESIVVLTLIQLANGSLHLFDSYPRTD